MAKIPHTLNPQIVSDVLHVVITREDNNKKYAGEFPPSNRAFELAEVSESLSNGNYTIKEIGNSLQVKVQSVLLSVPEVKDFSMWQEVIISFLIYLLYIFSYIVFPTGFFFFLLFLLCRLAHWESLKN
jgi:hypothetical protein